MKFMHSHTSKRIDFVLRVTPLFWFELPEINNYLKNINGA